MDPLSDPAIRSAVLSATFEALVGFQLTEEQLKYNVTRYALFPGRDLTRIGARPRLRSVDAGQPDRRARESVVESFEGRRRSNRPGISQASGTARATTLWKASLRKVATEGVSGSSIRGKLSGSVTEGAMDLKRTRRRRAVESSRSGVTR
jgi:hypothetical protein